MNARYKELTYEIAKWSVICTQAYYEWREWRELGNWQASVKYLEAVEKVHEAKHKLETHIWIND